MKAEAAAAQNFRLDPLPRELGEDLWMGNQGACFFRTSLYTSSGISEVLYPGPLDGWRPVTRSRLRSLTMIAPTFANESWNSLKFVV